MAKTVKANKDVPPGSVTWSITILTLAICCAAMAVMIEQNQELRMENQRLLSTSAVN